MSYQIFLSSLVSRFAPNFFGSAVSTVYSKPPSLEGDHGNPLTIFSRNWKWTEAALGLWLTCCVLLFVVDSWRWPLIQDSIFIHYAVFLMHHGMKPYRDIVELNLPTSYMIEAAAMAVLGPGSLAWRIFDFLLLGVSSAALWVIVRPQGKLPFILAASLFILVHGRDGALMAGERDLTATCFLLVAASLAFSANRFSGRRRLGLAFVFIAGLADAIAITIKPTLAAFFLCLAVWVIKMARNRRNPAWPWFAAAAAGAAIPVLATALFLTCHSAMAGFLTELHGLIPYHASLNKEPFGYLLYQSIAPLLGIFILWIVAAYFLRNMPGDSERIALMICSACGLLSYILQRKGFWYQRYPLIAFFIPVFAIDFGRLARSRMSSRFIGMAGLLAGVFLATSSLVHLRSYDRAEPPRPLLQDLSAFGSPQSLSGKIQCMDTIGPCIDALYNAGIVQSTGFIYDCYLLDGRSPVALELRRKFWEQLNRNPPQIIVVTDSNCYDAKHTFDKFERWPEFSAYLAGSYHLARESGPIPPARYWSHPTVSAAYRLYVRR